MTLKTKLMVSAAALLVSSGLVAAAPAIVADSVNLRAGPDPDAEIITAMPAGVPVDVLGCEGSWCRVAYRGAMGFADRDYLNIGMASIRPGYRAYGESTYGEGYVGEGYGPGYEGERYSSGYTTGYGGETYDTETVRGERAGVDVRGTEVRRGAEFRGRERVGERTSSSVRVRNGEERGTNVRANVESRGSRRGANADVNVDTNARTTTRAGTANRGARVGANADVNAKTGVNAGTNTRTTTGAGTSNRGPRNGGNVNANVDTNTRTTTGAGANTGDQADHGPNFIGAGRKYRDNHP